MLPCQPCNCGDFHNENGINEDSPVIEKHRPHIRIFTHIKFLLFHFLFFLTLSLRLLFALSPLHPAYNKSQELWTWYQLLCNLTCILLTWVRASELENYKLNSLTEISHLILPFALFPWFYERLKFISVRKHVKKC